MFDASLQLELFHGTTLRVNILSVAGETLDVELPATDTIAKVKHSVASAWSIPSSCSKLLRDAEVLKDDTIIGQCLYSNSIAGTIDANNLSLTVVVSLDVVHSNLNDDRVAKRVFALEELGILGLKGGDATVGIVVNCLEEKDERVQAAAAEALKKFATRGNQQIVTALLSKLKHKRSSVKKVVLNFLADLVEVSDQVALAEICSCFEQHASCSEVSMAAVEALGTLALQGDHTCIVNALTGLLSQKPKQVRKAAVRALAKLAERGVAIEVSAVTVGLSDVQSDVRIATLKAIAKICRKGDQDALTALTVCIADADCMVRLAALCAMGEIHDKGDKAAFAYSRLVGRSGRERKGASSEVSHTSGDEARMPVAAEDADAFDKYFAKDGRLILPPSCKRRANASCNSDEDGRSPTVANSCNMQ